MLEDVRDLDFREPGERSVIRALLQSPVGTRRLHTSYRHEADKRLTSRSRVGGEGKNERRNYKELTCRLFCRALQVFLWRREGKGEVGQHF